ncbi:hypothetical protein NEAUS05_1613 [Nematocida ausubeli]|nr:hypothetical protein NEAUS05_1613 [Nematocida ausubeli]
MLKQENMQSTANSKRSILPRNRSQVADRLYELSLAETMVKPEVATIKKPPTLINYAIYEAVAADTLGFPSILPN